MAVAYVTSLAPTAVTFDAAGETETVSFDAGSAANRLMLVWVNWFDKSNTITAVQYNGVDLSASGTIVSIDSGGFILDGQLWHSTSTLASGTNNLTVTMSVGSSNSLAQISAMVFSGANVGAAVSSYQHGSGFDGGPSTVSSNTSSITSTSGDMIAFFASSKNDSTNLTATATNYTEKQDAADGFGNSTEFGQANGAATVTPSAQWNNGAISVWWVCAGINIQQAAAGTTDTQEWRGYSPEPRMRSEGHTVY